MTKMIIDKGNFYSQSIKLIEESKKSVRFYSISCCFGFYSEGLETYGKVLLAIRHALGRVVDINVLTKVDHDNPIDVYAARRFAEIEIALSGDAQQDGRIFRELNSDAEQIQFIIVDDRSILLTSFQKENIDENLHLVLNKVEGGVLFESSDDPMQFRRYSSLFADAWSKSPPLQVDVRPVSRTMLRSFLLRWTAMPDTRNEQELVQLLMGYLQDLFSPRNVTIRPAATGNRIEILVRNRRRYERYGIEIKIKPDGAYADEIVKRLADSQEEYDGGFELLVVRPGYTSDKRTSLREQLGKIDVGLIELQ
jgi:hypothetical protein